MEDKRAQKTSQINEQHILKRSVNAMLIAERDLRDASNQDWNQTLRASCRIQRMALDGETCA